MKTPRLRVPKSTRGVTLVELMIVIVILGILAAITGPSVKRTIDRAAAKGVAREVANTMRMARNQAMSRGEALVVRITEATDASRGKIEIIRAGGSGSGSTGVPDPVPTALGGGSAEPVEYGTATDPIPRNCRQVSAIDLKDAPVVHSMTLDGMSGSGQMTVEPGTGTLDLCFSPDGRMLMKESATVPTGGYYAGCDENVVLVVADKGATVGNLGACIKGESPVAIRDKRDLINLYRVVVSYNGGIKVVQ